MPLTGGIVDNIQGALIVTGDGNDVLNVDDTGSAAAKTGTLTSSALIGLGMERFEASCAAVALHGLAGEAAGAKFGLRSPLARDVIDSIPDAIREYDKRFGS